MVTPRKQSGVPILSFVCYRPWTEPSSKDFHRLPVGNACSQAVSLAITTKYNTLKQEPQIMVIKKNSKGSNR
jgi:hypothetical protein